MAKILCISDLHYSINENDIYGEAINDDLEKTLKTDRLDVLFAALEELGGLDLMVFCGDFVLGRENYEIKKEAMKKFIEFLGKIENSEKIFNDANNNSKKIILLPGNHDVDRENKNDVLGEFKSSLSRYITPYEINKQDYKYAPVFIFDDLKLIIACESTVEQGATVNTKIKKASELLKTIKVEKRKTNQIINLLKDDIIYDIPAISEKTRNEFITNCKQINKKKKYSDYNKIMVTHHPLMGGIEKGKTVKKFNETIGGFEFLTVAKEFGYNLFVHGHIHEKACIEIIDHDSDKKTPLMQVGLPEFKIDDNKAAALIITTENGPKKNETISFVKIINITKSFKIIENINRRNTDVKGSHDGDMTLVDKEIEQLITENKIIKNGDIRNIEAASYDCALGYHYKKGNSKYCDWNQLPSIEIQSGDKPAFIELQANETILVYTYEEFDLPNNMIMHASPISSWIRKGLSVEMSHFIDPGFKGRFCFPISNESNKTIRISSRDPIMSIEIIKLGTSCSKNWYDRHSERNS